MQRIQRALLARQAVLEYERRNSEAVQEPCRVVAFGIEHEQALASAWADHDSGAVGFFLRRKINRDRSLAMTGSLRRLSKPTLNFPLTI